MRKKRENMNKKILVTRSSMPGMDEYVQEIRSLWDTHWITNMGQKHIELQNALKKYMNVDNVELLVNGHMALEMTLQAMNLQGGGDNDSFYICIYNPCDSQKWP